MGRDQVHYESRRVRIDAPENHVTARDRLDGLKREQGPLDLDDFREQFGPQDGAFEHINLRTPDLGIIDGAVENPVKITILDDIRLDRYDFSGTRTDELFSGRTACP